PHIGQAAATITFFKENEFNGREQPCGQVMTQHGDGNRWISNGQSQSLRSDTDFLDPRAVIDPSEQDETAWPYVRLNFFAIRIPAFELRSNLVNWQRLVAYIG